MRVDSYTSGATGAANAVAADVASKRLDVAKGTRLTCDGQFQSQVQQRFDADAKHHHGGWIHQRRNGSLSKNVPQDASPASPIGRAQRLIGNGSSESL